MQLALVLLPQPGPPWTSGSTQLSWVFFLPSRFCVPVYPKCAFRVKQSISKPAPTEETEDRCFFHTPVESIAPPADE